MAVTAWLKKYVLHIVALALLILAIGNFFLYEANAPKAAEEQFVSQVQEKVQNELEINQANITQAALAYQQNDAHSFKIFEKDSKYPFFIYEDGQLIYWSDHIYIPSNESISGDYENTLLVDASHKSLVSKLSFEHKGKSVEVVGLIPVYKSYKNENKYLQSGYDTELFSIAPSDLNTQPNDAIFQNITDQKGKFLFSVKPPTFEELSSTMIPINTLRILTVFILVLGLIVFITMSRLVQRYQYGWAFALLVGYLLAMRVFTLLNSIPFIFWENDLFNPRFFGIDKVTPSLGDFIINALCIAAVLLFVGIYYYKTKAYHAILKSSNVVKSIVSVVLILISLAITYMSYECLVDIYEKSEYFLDYSLSVSFSHLKMGVLSFFILLSIIFFLSQHILISIFYRIHQNKKRGFLHWVYGVLLGLVILIFTNEVSWIYLVIAAYFLFIYWFDFPRFFYDFKYKTTFYFFISAFVFTLIAVKVIDKEENKREIFNKETFGQKYLADNDPLAEGLLVRMKENIEKDNDIKQALFRESLAQQATSQKIKANHIDLYFDKFQTTVYTFDENGESLKLADNEPNKQERLDTYKVNLNKTDIEGIFFMNDINNSIIKQYVSLIEIDGRSIIIEMMEKDEYSESVYPELLTDKKNLQTPEGSQYSYALFNKSNDLLYSSGNFNYELLDSMIGSIKERKPYKQAHFSHLKLNGKNNKYIIVSSKDIKWKKLLSDFSFLFLILVVLISLVIILYGLRYGLKQMGMSFSTKIQLYLNAAFLVPLILVVIITLSVIRSTLMKVQENFYLENTKNTTSTVQLHLEGLKNNTMSRAFFEQEMNELAQETKLDINYYDKNGIIDYSTRSLIFQNGLLSNRINPKAYSQIIEELENEILLPEKLGDLEYRTAYVNLRDNSNQSMGVVSIPFFGSKTALDDQVSDVVNTILSVFIFLFILLLVISYYASNQLTHPLKVITQKIHSTNLDKLNEPLEWKTNDEIGVLTRSYNKMLEKLEESKDALSQSEKQTAWREMAKQVAHEIKNPLTPMKLSIQQLQRTLPRIEEKSRTRIERALNSLTEQIDTISEIANSFSEFAKMPVPRSEVFDMVEIVEKTAYLYLQNNKVDLKVESESSPINIRSDRGLINRVVTNIILNGIQSVPPTRQPKLRIKMYRNEEEKYAVLEISDNGSGIPADIHKKIFIPNFSTKVGGSGLGLAMAKRGIEHGGGNIWFETEEDEGTTFYVDIPLAV